MTALELVTAELRRHFPLMDDSELNRTLEGWELHPYEDDGVVTGVSLTKGTEFHFLATPKLRMSRQKMRACLEPMYRRYGLLTTRVPHGDLNSQRMNRVFGFTPTWADDQFQYSMMTELPFGERKTCQ